MVSKPIAFVQRCPAVTETRYLFIIEPQPANIGCEQGPTGFNSSTSCRLPRMIASAISNPPVPFGARTVRAHASLVEGARTDGGDASPRKPVSSFCYLNSLPEVIRPTMMMYVRFPLSLRNVEDLLFEHGTDTATRRCGIVEQVRPDVRRRHLPSARFADARFSTLAVTPRRDVHKLEGEIVYLWKAVDDEGEISESYIAKARDTCAAPRFMKKTLKRHGVTDKGNDRWPAQLWCGDERLGSFEKREVGRSADNRVETATYHSEDGSARSSASGE